MRQSLAAVALIARRTGSSPLWLVRWNDKWRAYHFPGGHKHPDESFHDCLVRELREELGLEDQRHYVFGDKARAHLEFVAWSESHQTETAYTMELFDVMLADEATASWLAVDAHNRWLTESEIRAGRAVDGRPVSRTTATLLDRLVGDTPGHATNS